MGKPIFAWDSRWPIHSYAIFTHLGQTLTAKTLHCAALDSGSVNAGDESRHITAAAAICLNLHGKSGVLASALI